MNTQKINNNYDEFGKSIRFVTSEKPIRLSEIKSIAHEGFGEMVKAVVDIKQNLMVISGELQHTDEEEWLLEWAISDQDYLWGVKIYPDKKHENFVEFTSQINIKSPQGNNTQEIKDPKIRQKITFVINSLIQDR